MDFWHTLQIEMVYKELRGIYIKLRAIEFQDFWLCENN